jgi:DNA-binding transcriptional LysR family regulator
METWQVMDGDKILTIRPQGRFKADNGAALVVAAAAGLGVAALPDGLTQGYINSGALVTVMKNHPPPPAGIYVVRPPGQHPSRKVRVLTEMLIECFDHSGQGNEQPV